MPQTADRSFLIWSLSGSMLGTTLTANGNSGSYSAANQNARTSVDLRWVDDVWLSVNVTGVSGTPTLQVFLNAFDNAGNLYGQGTTPLLACPGTGSISAASMTVVFGGRHGGGGSGSYFVLPEWGQVSWKVGGTTPSFTGVEIALYGR